MEATTAPTSPTTGSRTIADLLPLAAEKYARSRRPAPQARRRVARRHVRRGRRDRLGDRPRADRPRDRAGRPRLILANTRPEWTYVDFGHHRGRRVVVPIYPTNSPEECEWVVADSEAARGHLRGRDSWPRSPRSATTCRTCEHVVIVIDPSRRRRRTPSPLDDVRERGRGRDAAELEARAAAVKPDDPFTFIYTSGTTGPPKGCVLTHGNYRACSTCARRCGVIRGRTTSSTCSSRSRTPSRCSSSCCRSTSAARSPTSAATPRQIVARAGRGQADLPALGPADLREDLHARHGARRSARRSPQAGAGRARREGARRSSARREVPADLQRQASTRRRAAVQERPRHLRRQRAPGRHGRRADRAGDPRVLLRLRRPGPRGLRDDRDGDGRDVLDAREPQVRHRRPRAARRRVPDRRGRRAAHQGREHLPGLLQGRGRTLRRRSPTAGCTRATSARSTRTATSRSSGARRTSSSPRAARTSRRRNIENDLKQCRWISQAVMHGDRRPYPGDADHARPEEEIGPRRASRASRTTRPRWREHPKVQRAHPGASSTRSTPTTPRSSRSRSSRSSTTTSRRRPAS